MRRARGDGGQAVVEVALLLPVVALLAMLLLQVALVVRDQVLVQAAAREGAREAAVSESEDAVRAAAVGAGGLLPDRVQLRVAGRAAPGSRVTVELWYASPTELPLIGRLVGDVELSGSATMRVER